MGELAHFCHLILQFITSICQMCIHMPRKIGAKQKDGVFNSIFFLFRDI